MNRHVIIGRLGATDKAKIPVDTSEVVTEIAFVSANKRFDFGIGDAIESLRAWNVYPSEVGVDLMLLAAQIHAADTRISRSSESQDSWTREIRIVVPVSDVPRWYGVADILRRMMNFLTGDIWSFEFRSRPAGFESTVPPPLKAALVSPFDDLSLFSGGLDSLIGAIDALDYGCNPLFISHAGEGAVSAAQNALFRVLELKFPKRSFQRLRVWLNFPNGLIENVGSDNSTRGRSFLFFATGAMAGSGFGRPCILKAPENGLIALNVPLDQLRLGSMSTRTTHPFYIARWNEVLDKVGINVSVQNPYWNLTKGEMIAECKNRDLLKSLAPVSLSCSSPTKGRWTGHGPEHCGFCLPCLIRRAALKHGFRSKDATRYTLDDLRSETLISTQAHGEQIRSFQLAIARVSKKPTLAQLLIHKPGPLIDESPSQQFELAEVYRRGMKEVGRLLVGVSTAPD